MRRSCRYLRIAVLDDDIAVAVLGVEADNAVRARPVLDGERLAGSEEERMREAAGEALQPWRVAAAMTVDDGARDEGEGAHAMHDRRRKAFLGGGCRINRISGVIAGR